MEKSKYIWLDGELVDWDSANVSVMTHTLHYGTGVFEGMRARQTENGSGVFRLEDHVERLYRSAEAYNLDIPFDKKIISDAILEIVKVNNLNSAYIRPLVFLGDGEMGLLPGDVPVRVAIAAWEWGAYLGDEAGREGVKVCISDWQRISPKSFQPFAKGVGGYMNSTLAKIDAVKKGFDDAYRKSHQKFKIGQRGLSEVLSNAEEKLNKVFYNNSKLKLQEGEELYSNNKFKEALKVLSSVTHDEQQSKYALKLIEKIQIKLEDIDNQKYLKIEEENRIKREHELNLARIAAEKEISKVGN